jgi:adenylate cyclase
MTFRNITGEPADDWIGSGIAETVTGDLKNLHGLAVIGRERIAELLKNITSGKLTSEDSLAMDIGRRLGASFAITGGYQRMGEMIRITARFVDIANGAIVKTVKIDGKVSEIFDLQDRIVSELSDGLRVALPAGHHDPGSHERRETLSVEAYEDFSRGLMNLRMGSSDSLDRAIHLFQKAVEHDPNYASAWAALGRAYDLKASFLTLPDLALKAIEYQRKAISINPKLSHAHLGLGAAYSTIGQYDAAIEAFKETIRLDPANAGAHASLGRAYWIGKGMIDEGINELEQAVRINPEAGWAHLQLALLHTLRGNYERAEAACLQAIEMQEQYLSGREGMQIIGARTRLGYVYYCQGRYDDALREYNKELEFLGASDHALRDRGLIELNQKIGAAYLKKGMPVEAGQHFKRAIKGFDQRVAQGADDASTKYYIACLYALRGDSDRAVKYLEETMPLLATINAVRARIDPDLESIRSHPRFRELIGDA